MKHHFEARNSSFFRLQKGLIKQGRQIIGMLISVQNHIAAAAAIAAIGSAPWHKFLSTKTHATATTVPALSKNSYPIDKH